MSTPTAFDLSVAPTEGLTVLEASAGTGKTYSLAGLTVLGLATGRVTTREVLVVTFTEAATAELSGRLRRRLAEAVDLLERATSDPTVVSDDTVDRILLEADPDELAVRSGRLVAALAEFDAMTVSTIHGFCQRLLAAAGATAVSVTGDDSDIDEVVIDRILAAGVELAKPDRVVTAVKRRLALPDAEMGRHPAAAAELRNDLDGLIDLVDGAVDEVRVRRARWRRRTFDSMLSETRDLLGHPVHGPGMVAELRERFRLVLIDEFQDTDRVQWDIFRTAFLDGSPDGAGSGARRSAVVVVGDPKQSIYRFRGAELSAYLEAVGYAVATGGSLHTLGTNFRSDAALLTALEHILTGATFGDPSVAFQPVAAGRSDTKRLIDPDGATAALRWRLAHPPADAKGAVAAPDGHRYVKADLVAQVVHHLTTVRIVRANGTEEALRPSDIGILVRANSYAEEVAEMLRVAGVPVTTSGSDSVLDSVAAQHWDTLIASLQRPSSPSDARAVAVGAFGHLDAQAVADLTERDEAALLERQRDLVGALSRGGVPRLMVELRRNGHQRRILAHLGGERLLTDLEHIAEILQRATDGRPTSAARLAAVIAELRSADDDSVSSDLLDRRLDRDDETVKIMTIHKAKGLEFPVVFCPALWPIPSGGRSEIPHAHVPGEGRRFSTYWLTGGTSKAKGVTDVAKLAGGEQDGEQRRQLYVALTRAVHRLVVWDVPGFSRSNQPLRSLLRDTGCSDLDAVADASNGTIDVTAVTSLAAAAHLDIDTTRPADLEVAAFERDLASAWRVWSFTAIERSVADGDDAHRPIEPLPAPAGGLDEPSAEATGSTPVENAPVTLRTVPGSAAFGSLVHGVLETVDFASSTLDDDLEAACDDALRHRAMGVGADVLAAGLADALRAPLGGPLGGRRLVDLTSGDRLDELEFHLPLAAFSALDLAAVVAAGLADDDPMRPWFAAAADGALDVDVAGMLTGSIDLVARIDGRYLVADYKTNRIGPDATFTDSEMVAEMHRHAYPLQAVLYLVALRRYLRFRTGASTADDLARVDASILGAAYLFVRGMDPGRSAADACGVVWWTPPTTVIADLDELFSTGGTR